MKTCLSSIACCLVLCAGASASAFAQDPPPTQAHKAEAQAAEQTQDKHASFNDLDKDKDGRLSAEEAGNAVTGFAAMDANGDGYISDAEYRAQSKSMGKMEEGKPAPTPPDKAPSA